MNESQHPQDRPQTDWAAVLRQAQGDQFNAANQEFMNERDALLQRLCPALPNDERDSIYNLYSDVAGETRDAIVGDLIETDADPNADGGEFLGRLTDGFFSLFAQGWIAALSSTRNPADRPAAV